jgi:hypothetical protein
LASVPGDPGDPGIVGVVGVVGVYLAIHLAHRDLLSSHLSFVTLSHA